MYIQSNEFYQAIDSRLIHLVNEPEACLLIRYGFVGLEPQTCVQLWASEYGKQANYELKVGKRLDTAITQSFSRKRDGVEFMFKQLDRLVGRMIQNEAYDLDLLEGSECKIETVLAPKFYNGTELDLIWSSAGTVMIPTGFRLQYLDRLNPPVLK